jgi:hypothetical protein
MASPTCLLRNDKPLVVKHSQRQIRTFTASAIAHNIHTSLDHADGGTLIIGCAANHGMRERNRVRRGDWGLQCRLMVAADERVKV